MGDSAVETSDILIIGTGFAGLGMAIRLKQAGIDDFVVLERAADLGGTWRDNHYPGAACDVESHLYSFSFEPNPEWSHMFARQGEIWSYMERVAEKYDLRRHIRFDCNVVGAEFDEDAQCWFVTTSGGQRYRARVVVGCTGGLSRPSKPDLRGLDTFRGKAFHSACWDDAYPLEGKRVGVVGTGASAIQLVPAIAPRVTKLHVFQRTPPWIIPRADRPISDREKTWFRTAPMLQKVQRTAIFWKRELFGLGFIVDKRVLELGQRLATSHLRRSVRDPALREKLTPKYLMGCKRVLLSNDYYPALTRDNVELVTDGIAEVVPEGIRTNDGTTRPLDALVLATGFEAAEQLAPFEIRGQDGARLSQAWREGGEAYRGTTISGFPNLFLVVGPNTGLGHGSMIFMIEAQIEYILGALRWMRDRGHHAIDVRASEQRHYNARIQQRLGKAVWSTGGCSNWYTTRTGKNTTLWPGFMFEFRLQMRSFDPEAYEGRPRAIAATS